MSVEDPKDKSQDPNFDEFSSTVNEKSGDQSSKSFEDVAVEAETKLSKEQFEELGFMKGFVRRSYDETGILDFELVEDLIREHQVAPIGKERAFAEFIIDSVGREKREADEHSKKASAAEPTGSKEEEIFKMWENIKREHEEREKAKNDADRQRQEQEAKAKEDSKAREDREKEKRRIYMEKKNEIISASIAHFGISAGDYEEIIKGTFGDDPYTTFNLAQKILGITSMDEKELKHAYLRECKKYHPDKNNGTQHTIEEELITEEKMKIVQRFYQTLEKRR
ncbi:MAG TPA: J domain-containing protein [Candidatus Bathyarchaeia archaeon]|nr:J domain-containing protein [Candidatus Bathyarchaeia archaeon]